MPVVKRKPILLLALRLRVQEMGFFPLVGFLDLLALDCALATEFLALEL